jgi:hypothetical protein
MGLEKRDEAEGVLFSYRVSWRLPADFKGLRFDFESGYEIGSLLSKTELTSV